MAGVPVKFAILVLVPSVGVSLYFFRPLYEFFMLDLREHLGDGSVEGAVVLGWFGEVEYEDACRYFSFLSLGLTSCFSPHPYIQIVWHQSPSFYDRPFLASFAWPRLILL